MDEWRKAGSVKKLFQKSTPSAPPPLPSSPTAPSESEPEPDTSATKKETVATFGASAKLAGQLTAKKTELTKIQQVSLPGQYVVVGSQVFKDGAQRQEHESLFEEIERLNNVIGELEKSGENQPEAKTFADKAMALGGKAVTTAKLKTAELQRRQKYIHLGKSVFDSEKTSSECQQQKAEIERLLARANELQSEIADIKGTLTEHGREAAASGHSFLFSTAVVLSLAVFCAPIGLFLIWRHPTWEKQTKLRWAGVSIACFVGFMVIAQMNESAAVKELASADQRWGDGKQVDAIEKYRELIDNSFLPNDEQARVFRRVIEFDCGNDNLESAKKLIQKAKRRNIELTLTHPEAKAFLAELNTMPVATHQFNEGTKKAGNRQTKMETTGGDWQPRNETEREILKHAQATGQLWLLKEDPDLYYGR